MDMQSFMVYWVSFFVERNTNSESLFMLLLSAVLNYHLTSLYKHMFYFQARVEQAVPFLLLSTFSSYYGAKHETNRTESSGDLRINVPNWVPRKHTPHLYLRHKQD